MQSVTKEIFLAALSCSSRGWFLMKSEGVVAPTEAELFRMEQGSEIGIRARSLYPDGVLIAPGAKTEMAKETRGVLGLTPPRPVFEATFTAGDLIAKADILLPDTGGWRIIEVKAALENTSKLAEYIDDVAYTVSVASKSGIHVTRATLLLISRSYQQGMDADSLFVVVDVSEEALARAGQFAFQHSGIAEIMAWEHCPAAHLNKDCRHCEFFDSVCLGQGLDSSLFTIPNLKGRKLDDLAAAGIASARCSSRFPPFFRTRNCSEAYKGRHDPRIDQVLVP